MVPVDEMLGDLRDKLEAFARAPSHEAFDAIQREMRRVERCCEDVLCADEDDGEDCDDTWAGDNLMGASG